MTYSEREKFYLKLKLSCILNCNRIAAVTTLKISQTFSLFLKQIFSVFAYKTFSHAIFVYSSSIFFENF